MPHDFMPSSSAEHRCDVLVTAGGPAGSTAATLLAVNLPLFEKLGVRAEVEAIGMEKWGAEFISPWHEHRQSFEFADAWHKSMPRPFQVRRSEFDELLIRNAGRKGADVIEGCRVREVEFLPDDEGVIVFRPHDAWKQRKMNIRYAEAPEGMGSQ